MSIVNNAGDRNRRARIELRVTVSEKKQLLFQCNEAGLSISDWIRSKALGLEPLLRKPNPDREILLRLLAAFGRIGSLLNQMTRAMHRKQQSDEYEIPIRDINLLLEDFKTLSNELRQEIKKH